MKVPSRPAEDGARVELEPDFLGELAQQRGLFRRFARVDAAAGKRPLIQDGWRRCRARGSGSARLRGSTASGAATPASHGAVALFGDWRSATAATRCAPGIARCSSNAPRRRLTWSFSASSNCMGSTPSPASKLRFGDDHARTVGARCGLDRTPARARFQSGAGMLSRTSPDTASAGVAGSTSMWPADSGSVLRRMAMDESSTKRSPARSAGRAAGRMAGPGAQAGAAGAGEGVRRMHATKADEVGAHRCSGMRAADGPVDADGAIGRLVARAERSRGVIESARSSAAAPARRVVTASLARRWASALQGGASVQGERAATAAWIAPNAFGRGGGTRPAARSGRARRASWPCVHCRATRCRSPPPEGDLGSTVGSRSTPAPPRRDGRSERAQHRHGLVEADAGVGDRDAVL